MHIGEIMGQCAVVERMIAEVYESFAERWPDPPIGDLWRQLATEELGHGVRLHEARCLPAAEREDPAFDSTRLAAIRDFVRSRLPNAQTTLDQAFAAALDIERLELDNIYCRLLAITTDDWRMSTVFRGTLGEPDNHQQRLLSAIEEYAKDPELRERARRAHRRLLAEAAAQGTAE